MDSFGRASAPGAINWPAFRDRVAQHRPRCRPRRSVHGAIGSFHARAAGSFAGAPLDHRRSLRRSRLHRPSPTSQAGRPAAVAPTGNRGPYRLRGIPQNDRPRAHTRRRQSSRHGGTRGRVGARARAQGEGTHRVRRARGHPRPALIGMIARTAAWCLAFVPCVGAGCGAGSCDPCTGCRDRMHGAGPHVYPRFLWMILVERALGGPTRIGER